MRMNQATISLYKCHHHARGRSMKAALSLQLPQAFGESLDMYKAGQNKKLCTVAVSLVLDSAVFF